MKNNKPTTQLVRGLGAAVGLCGLLLGSAHQISGASADSHGTDVSSVSVVPGPFVCSNGQTYQVKAHLRSYYVEGSGDARIEPCAELEAAGLGRAKEPVVQEPAPPASVVPGPFVCSNGQTYQVKAHLRSYYVEGSGDARIEPCAELEAAGLGRAKEPVVQEPAPPPVTFAAGSHQCSTGRTYQINANNTYHQTNQPDRIKTCPELEAAGLVRIDAPSQGYGSYGKGSHQCSTGRSYYINDNGTYYQTNQPDRIKTCPELQTAGLTRVDAPYTSPEPDGSYEPTSGSDVGDGFAPDGEPDVGPTGTPCGSCP